MLPTFPPRLPTKTHNGSTTTLTRVNKWHFKVEFQRNEQENECQVITLSDLLKLLTLSVSASLSFPVHPFPPLYMHAHIHMYTHTHACAHKHAHTHTLMYTHCCTLYHAKEQTAD